MSNCFRNVIFVSTSCTAPTTSSLNWDVEPVRRNSTLHAYINGSQHQITQHVHSVEICFNVLVEVVKSTKALDIFIVDNIYFFGKICIKTGPGNRGLFA